MNLKINLPESNNIAELKARLILESINKQEISNENNQKLIGKKLKCIIDGITEDGEMYITRSYMDVPDIDGFVFVKKEKEHEIGEFIDAKIMDAFDYDLVAEEIMTNI